MKSKRLLQAKKTQVLLLSKIRGLGKRGDSVLVANGYFRNYLFPRELACKYNAEKEKELQSVVQEHQEYQEIKNPLQDKVLFFAEQANTLGVLFNSIKKKNIVENILTNYKNIDESYLKESLDKSRIIIDKPIKKIGVYPIMIEMGEEVINMRVSVGRSIEEAKGGI
jgi:large subunit ribosomal protein L9